MAEAGDFSLIIEAVDKEQLSDAAVQFAAAFSLDATLAQQICKSAPIIFAQKLTKSEVKAITPRLKELSNAGLEFRVTARGTGKVPKVNWPVRPQFTAGDSGGPNGLAFEWENSAFVCPSCGETYLFRRLGKLDLAPTERSTAPAAAPPEETVETLREDLMSVEAAPDVAPEPAAEPAPELEPLADAGGMDEIELQPEAPAAEQPVAEAPAAEEPALDLEPEPAAEPASSAPLPLEETQIEDGDFTAAAEEAQAAPPAPAPAPEPEEEPEEEGGDKYNVFLSKITDSSKRKKAVDLIAKVKGCSEGEAKELTTRLVIPLAKGVGQKKAESILNSFKKLKIFGRMTKVK